MTRSQSHEPSTHTLSDTVDASIALLSKVLWVVTGIVFVAVLLMASGARS